MNYLVVGLGNIGDEYALTRHNMGFMILDAWAQASNIVFSTRRYGAVAETDFKGRHITLLKPSTYMNLSGNAVSFWLKKAKVPIENLLVISDDINLPFGTIRMRQRGSSGGHNGLENIEFCLDTQDYARIRIGIGNDYRQGELISHVLGRLSPEQLEQIPALSEAVVAGIKDFVTIGAERAMNVLNTRKKKEM
jgi:PTH1 family peptidyl-tRNA hydrolase